MKRILRFFTEELVKDKGFIHQVNEDPNDPRNWNWILNKGEFTILINCFFDVKLIRKDSIVLEIVIDDEFDFDNLIDFISNDL
jgi:hypothetical protein